MVQSGGWASQQELTPGARPPGPSEGLGPPPPDQEPWHPRPSGGLCVVGGVSGNGMGKTCLFSSKTHFPLSPGRGLCAHPFGLFRCPHA